MMAVNFMTSTSLNVSGRLIGAPDMKDFCLYNGFMTQFFVVQTDYWVLTIAICTFFLVGDHERSSKWVQSHRLIVFTIPPLVSAIWAAIGLGLKAYDNIGGWCWFPSDRTRLLVNFVPRWIIVIGCLGVYFHLFLTIFRTQHHTATSSSADDRWLTSEYEMEDGEKPASSKTTVRSSKRDSVMRRVKRSSTASQYSLAPALKKIAYQMMTYPLIYMAIWSIPTAIRIYQATTGHAAPTPVATLDKVSQLDAMHNLKANFRTSLVSLSKDLRTRWSMGTMRAPLRPGGISCFGGRGLRSRRRRFDDPS
jgi:hypothetical protein